jgi:predicted nucleotidyltransferase component of viral defense system
MIPETFIEDWRNTANWSDLNMIEQDLIISRALICLYNEPIIKESLVFRGGTALNKLFIKPPARYSEDIDFVQIHKEPIGATINAIRKVLKPWLGEPNRKITERGAKLVYRYQAISGLGARLKIEINTTEHFQVLPFRLEKLNVESEWFNGSSEIITYELAELMATKLRALYQRRKGRDLFDLWYVFKNDLVDVDKVIGIFKKYCANEGIIITKKLFEQNIALKKLNLDFSTDMKVLLPHKTSWNFDEAFSFVQSHVIERLL